MKTNNNKGIVPILIIIVLLIIVGAGFFAQNQARNKKINPPVVVPEEKEEPTKEENKKSPVVTKSDKEINLGDEFTLGKNEMVKINNTGLEIKIVKFYNSPCPVGSQCIWSGMGIDFECYLNGQLEGTELMQGPFSYYQRKIFKTGYQMKIIKTDYETYANLIITKI